MHIDIHYFLYMDFQYQLLCLPILPLATVEPFSFVVRIPPVATPYRTLATFHPCGTLFVAPLCPDVQKQIWIPKPYSITSFARWPVLIVVVLRLVKIFMESTFLVMDVFEAIHVDVQLSSL